jgi:hypothetical protein
MKMKKCSNCKTNLPDESIEDSFHLKCRGLQWENRNTFLDGSWLSLGNGGYMKRNINKPEESE